LNLRHLVGGIGGAREVEGALVNDGNFESVEEETGALEVDLSGSDGLKEHGGGELNGFGVFGGAGTRFRSGEDRRGRRRGDLLRGRLPERWNPPASRR
jgi:hypothetical protein